MARRLHIAFVVAGFPTSDNPGRGIFNLRALQALRSVAEVTPILLRAWRPGRPVRSIVTAAGTQIVAVAVPQLPIHRGLTSTAIAANILAYRIIGWPAVRHLITESDLVHSVDLGVGMIAGYWAGRARKCHIAQATGSDVNTVTPTLPSFVARGLRRQLRGVACNSEDLARRFSVLYPGVSNVRVVYRGVDTGLFNLTGSQSGPQAHGSGVRFAYFGGFRRHSLPQAGSDIKGGFMLLSAWKSAERELPRTASLLLAGPDATGALIGPWRRTLQYPERIHVVGQISPGDIAGYIRAADVVMVPSIEEGLPNVCMEAGACGRAVIASDAGGIPEVVIDGETGVILPRNNIRAWCEGLITYSKRPGVLSELGRRGRIRAEQLFDARDYAPRMLDMYETALGLLGIPEIKR
jgi:glycosyltransferase involved in cell wall biosynthesis